MAIKYRNDVFISKIGWEACLRDKAYDTKQSSNLNKHTYCHENQIKDKLPIPYNEAWLEYKEDGTHHDKNQIKAILKWIKAQKKPLTVIVYVHGWHQNADISNNDPRNNAIKFSFLLSRVVYNVKRLATYGKINEQKVLGIYMGWRGEENTKITNIFTIGSRAKVATRIGQRGIIKSDLQKIALAIGKHSHLMVLGHSLGGRILTSAFRSDLECKDPNVFSEFNTTAPLGENSLIITLNPAVNADCYESVFKYKGCNPRTPRPYWINITSEDDKATKIVYGAASFFHMVNGCKERDYLYQSTIGHYNEYLRQVIDQVDICGPSDKSLEKDSDEMAWFLHPNPKLVLQFQNFFDTDKIENRCRTLHFGLQADNIPERALKRKVWNVRTDQSLMDFGDEGGGGIIGLHSGYISTILMRLFTDMLFYVPKEGGKDSI